LAILQCDGISLSFGSQTVLSSVSLHVEPGARMSLAGANGSGKSTLLKILARKVQADAGSITCPIGTTVAYLAQYGVEFRDRTIRQTAEEAFSDQINLELQISQVSESIGLECDVRKKNRLVSELSELQEKLDNSGFYARAGKIQAILEGLGFRPSQFEAPVESLSGGWQMRLALAQVLLREADVILLDEPTNYLDLETREWLVDYLSRSRIALVIVSHDRWVLDKLVTSVAEIWQSKVHVYPGSYNDYEAKRALELEQTIAAWKKQQEDIERLERFVERFGAKATKASQAKSRQKELDRMELIVIPDGLRHLQFHFPAPPSSGEIVVRCQNLFKAYGPKPVLAGVNVEVKRGEKLALLGRNGAGKSTFLKILAGDSLPDSGTFLLGHNVKLAWFAQDAGDTLDPAKLVIEEVEDGAPTELVPQLRNLLGSFLFQDDEVFKPISVLSGGERSRVALLKMLLSPANLLILDEPTNHLDLTSKEILLDALKAFPGTVIFVSHDRYFIRDLATAILELVPVENNASDWKYYEGGLDYYDWIKAKNNDSDHLEVTPNKDVITASIGQSAAKIREETKERKTLIRRLEREEKEALESIEKLEAQIKVINEQLGLPEVYSNGDITKSLQSKLKEIENKLAELQTYWEKIASQLEQAQQPV